MSELTQEDLQIISEEEQVLADVLKALHHDIQAQTSDEGVNRDAFLDLLKNSGNTSEADLPTLLQELENKQRLENRTRSAPLPSIQTPYFGRLVLQEEKKERQLLLGYTSFLSSKCKYPIVDWRNAPVAKIFYECKEGDDFEQQLPGRWSEGVVKTRRIITIQNGILEQIQTAKCIYRKNKSQWSKELLGEVSFLHGELGAVRAGNFGVGKGGRPSPQVSALLDETQFELLNGDENKPLLVLGGAGSGKTTVALHRVASLAFKDPQRFNANSIAVIVPDEGLVRLSRNLLSLIGMRNIFVSTFDKWIHTQAHQVIHGLPTRLCDETPARVIRFKRHPAMMAAAQIYVQEYAKGILARIVRMFPTLHQIEHEHIPEFSSKKPLTHWLKEIQKKLEILYADKGKDKFKGVEDFIKQEKMKLYRIADDRTLLFTDRIILERGVQGYEQEITREAIEELIAHTRAQSSLASSEAFKDIDEDRLRTIDGEDITHEQDAVVDTIDVEDYPVLFEILRLKTGAIETPFGKLKEYAHLVLDEAQELAPLEVATLGMALAKPQSVTIAGDAAQQTDLRGSFASWENILKIMGIEGVQATHLTTNYRSPKPVSDFAHAVLGSTAGIAPKATKPGAPVLRSEYKTYGEAIFSMYDVLNSLMEHEPNCSVAIVARTEKSAERFYEDLKRHPDVRLVTKGDFSFTPGIDVTHVINVKGLEFDYVIVPDADASTYPDDAKSRRTLHVACTRAVHQLWVISSSTPASILPAKE